MLYNMQTEVVVNNHKIHVKYINGDEYICLTDLARYEDNDNPSDVVKQWMSNKDSFDFYGLWETINNKNFNSVEFHRIKTDSYSRHRFLMTPTKWKNLTNAIGIRPGVGKYSEGTYAHSDIAFEFASWLSPEFKLYLITELQRLKKQEYHDKQRVWEANRFLTKANYLVLTDAVKKYIVPSLSIKQIQNAYADEADVLNVALFGLTAKEWRNKNPELARNGNIRDHANILELIILNNLENLNANMIKDNIPQDQRIIKLNEEAKSQLVLFKNNISIEFLSK